MVEIDDILPVRDETSEPFFAAAAEGRLLVQRDPVDGRFIFYPRARVPGHPDRVPEWVEASGTGTLYSFTVVMRSLHPQFRSVPFTIALVDLAEGVRMTSWIVDTPPEALRCGMALRVAFREVHPGTILPCFVAA